MHAASRKTLYQNALVMVWADGELSPREAAFISALEQRAGIDAAQAAAWAAEVRADPQLRPIERPEESRAVLDLLIVAASADGVLDDGERRLLVTWAKSAGLPFAELKQLVKERWQANVLDDLFGAPPPREVVYVVRDHFEKLDGFLQATSKVPTEVVTLAQAQKRGLRPACFVFHVAAERAASLQLLAALRSQAMGAKIIPVVGRYQAAQISYLREAGAHRCLVEDVYPGELEAVVAEKQTFGAKLSV